LYREGVMFSRMTIQQATALSAGLGGRAVAAALGATSSGSLAGQAAGKYANAYLTAQQMDAGLSRIFDELYATAGPRQRMDPGLGLLKTQLLPHQQEALAWMISRENLSGLPPFWTAKRVAGSKDWVFVNSLTRHETKTRPKTLRCALRLTAVRCCGNRPAS
jgi:hypothetical protein